MGDSTVEKCFSLSCCRRFRRQDRHSTLNLSAFLSAGVCGKRKLCNLLFLPLAALICGCASTVPYDQLTVFGNGDSKANGTIPAYRLRSSGSWGAGQLASGKADMVFDGLYYYQLAGGRASALTASEPLSSGWAVKFRPDRVETLPADFDAAALSARLAKLVPDSSMACVSRVSGQFAFVTVVSPSGSRSQLSRTSGYIYGIRMPKSGAAGVESGFWFLSSDYSAGGRVADFKMTGGSLAVDLCPRNLTVNLGINAAEKSLR